MANYCDYEIRVKGSKNAGQMVFHSMPCMDYKDIEWEKETGGTTTLCFTGNCKWSVNYGVNDNLNPVNVDSMSESEIEDKGMDYWEYSLRAKSEAFQCEIMVHYWSEESEFDQFDHYKNGKLLKQRKIECNYDEQNKFDWDTLEFLGHEGEYDESVDGEQQDAKFFMAANMAAQMAYGGGQDQQEPEMSDEDANNLDDINSQLADLLDEVKDLAAEVGVDINAEQIGDTGFDMYDWTFTNGNRKSGKGWSVAIPDGFVVIDSNEGRVFEAVPQGMEESDPESIPIQILPGVEQQVPRQGDDLWMYHPYAREGTAEVFAVETSKVMMQLMGSAPEIISVAFDDIYAYALIGDTSGGSYTYQCSVFTDGKMQQIRVQTGSILYDQKQILTKSILTWLKSFKFDKPNAAMPKETQLESSKVLSDLKNGKTTSFDAAVKRAQDEYVITVNGRLNTIQYSSEYGILDWDTAPDTVREILSHGMDVKEFYYQKADELIEKLKLSQVKASTMKKVYKKLEDLKDVKTTFALDDDITVDLPAKVKEIQKKWKNEAAKITEPKETEEPEGQLEFKQPEYSSNNKAMIGPLSVVLPDDFDYVTDGHIPANDNKAANLLDNYVMVAAPADCDGGLSNFKDALLGINISKPQETGLDEDKWKDISTIKKNIISSNPGRNMKIAKEGTNSLLAYGKGNECGNPAEPYWVSYFVMILCGSLHYSANLYFNSKKTNESEYTKAVENFCSHITFNTDDLGEVESDLLRDELGDMIAENGRMDGILASQLYSKDVIFNNDDEVTYDGTHTIVTSCQFNSLVMDKYPNLVKHVKTLVHEMTRVIAFVDQNEDLMIPKSKFHRNILNATRNNPITGATVFELCAWHMLLITKSEKNKYNAAIDSNLIYGIPDAFAFVGEFIKTLRAYNEIYDNFEVTYVSTINVDGPCGNIETPVRGAVTGSTKTIIVKGGKQGESERYAEKIKEIDSVSAEDYAKSKIERLESKVDTAVKAGLKAAAKDAKALFTKISTAIKAKDFNGLDDIDSVIERVNEAVDASIDILAFNLVYMYRPFVNSYEMAYYAQNVVSNADFGGRIQMVITENTFNPNAFPKSLCGQLDSLTEEDIYAQLLEDAEDKISEGHETISESSVTNENALEEERKRAEEAEKEEQRKIEEAAKAKEAEQRAWEEETERVKRDRERALEQRLIDIQKEKNNSIASAEEEKKNALLNLDEEINQLKMGLYEMERQLALSGFLAGGKKSELKRQIQNSTEKIQELLSKRENVSATFESKLSDIIAKAEKDTSDARRYVEEKMPLPDRP